MITVCRTCLTQQLSFCHWAPPLLQQWILLGQHCTILWNEVVKLSKVIKGYNLAGCCRDSGGMIISSKNPIETVEKRNWWRLKQFFVNDVPQRFLYCISRLILLTLSGRRWCRNYSLSHNTQFQLAAKQSPSWKSIQQQRAQSVCPLGKEKAGAGLEMKAFQEMSQML